MKRHTVLGVAAIVAGVVLAFFGWQWWQQRTADSAARPRAAATAEPVPALPAAAPQPAPAPEPLANAAPLGEGEVGSALLAVLGGKAPPWLLLDDFARRFVASVDNLAREHAPALAWPVDTTAGQFKVIEYQGRTVIDPDNATRYLPFVQLMERVDDAQAVALYARALPVLQQTYAALGFPQRRFHARLLQVIDHLLAAPAAPELIDVKLTEVRGPIPAQRPWLRYEFADPALQSASAGHKIMVRVGAANQRRLQARLRALRAELVRRGGS
jgi:hypothetical protein